MAQAPPAIEGDFTPIRVDVGAEPFVILVGHAGGGLARVQANGAYCALDREGRWASAPMPYRPGMPVAVVFITGQGKTHEVHATLPGPDELGPVFGPGWTWYAPDAPGGDSPCSPETGA